MSKKLVRIAPVAPYPGAVGFPYSQTHPNVEQDVDEEDAADLVASGAFRYAHSRGDKRAPMGEDELAAEDRGLV